MCKQLVEKSVKNLNQFTSRDGIADNMSTLTMMTGRPFPEYSEFSLEFGSYVQVFKDNDPTNTMKLRTTPAIALNPTNNLQGGYDFMSLVTGCKLERQQWDVIPMPRHVIQAVESMAEREEQPLLQNGEMIFEWGPNRPIIKEHEQNVEYTDTDQVEQEIEVEEELTIQPDDDEYSNVEEVGGNATRFGPG